MTEPRYTKARPYSGQLVNRRLRYCAPLLTVAFQRHKSRETSSGARHWSVTPSKVSRKVLRFFKRCCHNKVSQKLYDDNLRPMLRGSLGNEQDSVALL